MNDHLRTDISNYQPLFGSEEMSRLEQGDIPRAVGMTLNFARPSATRGFYLGLRDTGTCGNINRIIMYYRVVAGRTDTFLSCPDVPLLVIGSQTTSTLDCMCHNNTSGVGSLGRTCDQDGVCNEDQRCECDPGLGYNSTLEMCLG